MRFKAKPAPRNKVHQVHQKWKRESQHDYATRRMAALIRTPQDLQGVLLQIDPVMRQSVLERLKPYLPFRPLEQDQATAQKP